MARQWQALPRPPSPPSAAMTLDGGLATFRAVEQYPYHEIRRKLFKTMRYTGGSKEKRSGAERLAPPVADKNTATRGNDVYLVPRVR